MNGSDLEDPASLELRKQLIVQTLRPGDALSLRLLSRARYNLYQTVHASTRHKKRPLST